MKLLSLKWWALSLSLNVLNTIQHVKGLKIISCYEVTISPTIWTPFQYRYCLSRYKDSHSKAKMSLYWDLPTGLQGTWSYCPACRTSLIATRFWVVMICPIIKCLTVLEFSFILLDLCLFITIFNFILNYVPTVTFWIFTYHKIWILLIIFCFIWNYWIIYFLTCLEVFWSVVS